MILEWPQILMSVLIGISIYNAKKVEGYSWLTTIIGIGIFVLLLVAGGFFG